MNTFFERGEVVWGKIKGYPWWPANIIDFNNNLVYTIKFYSDNSYAKLSSKFLLKYEENKNKILEANKKNKKLLSAIKEADLDLKKLNNTNYLPLDNIDNSYNIISNNNSKIKINTEKIQIKKINNSIQKFEPKNFEKINNNDLYNNLFNKSDTMSTQNNKVNIFSIVKNSKSSNTINIQYSPSSSYPMEEENYITSKKNNSNIDTNSNNNDIIINKNKLCLNNDDEINFLLLNNNNNKNKEALKKENEKTKKIKNFQKKEKKEEEIKEKEKEKEIKEKEIKQKEKEKEEYYIKIEIENLDNKNYKRKDIKTKTKVDDKAKEEKKKREEEDNFLYEIDEYFYKILEIFNKKQFDKLDYEKVQLRRVLIYLANFKRKNFVEFLKMTNISKYIQYFVCYLKDYDQELSILAKNVYRNFHKQFNKEYFGNKLYKV